MTRTAIALTLILALSVSTVAGRFVDLATANPYFYGGRKPAPENSEPPIISVISPTNNSLTASNNVRLTFSARTSKDTYMFVYVYYEVDWREDTNYVFQVNTRSYDHVTQVPYNEILSGIPEGKHSICIYANALGAYIVEQTAYYYNLTGLCSIYIAVDYTPPGVSILSIENTTYTTSDLPLDFSVNEEALTSYVVDGVQNVTTNGNATLSQLAYGKHNLTVYATDLAGNGGASETVTFTIAEPFPITSVIAASGVSIGIVGLGLLLHFKKRKHRTGLS